MVFIKNLLLFVILGMSTSVGFFYVKKMGLTNPFAIEVHRVSFSTKTCLSCPACPCEYIIDNKTSYTLASDKKTVCDVNPLGSYSASIRNALIENKDEVHITLKGVFYDNFSQCLEENAKQRSI